MNNVFALTSAKASIPQLSQGGWPIRRTIHLGHQLIKAALTIVLPEERRSACALHAQATALTAVRSLSVGVNHDILISFFFLIGSVGWAECVVHMQKDKYENDVRGCSEDTKENCFAW